MITAENKIKVFISSTCGEETYDAMRKKIKEQLEATGLINVYIFESQASTLSTVASYTLKLDDCDVAIFLIDDTFETHQGVQIEVQRAKNINKKSLYYFCGENAKNKVLLKQGLIESQTCVFHTLNSIDEFDDKCVKDLVNEIADIYHYYCHNQIKHEEAEQYQGFVLQTSDAKVKKSLFANTDKCRDFFTYFLFAHHIDVKNTNDFDSYCSKFLEVIYAGRSITDFNLALFLQTLKNQQQTWLFEIVKLRWEAIQYLYLDKVSECLDKLKEALELAKSQDIPDWIIQDILLDIRNIYRIIDNQNDTLTYDNFAQKELNESESIVNYPWLDRYVNNIYDALIKEEFKQNMQSPYTITFGGGLNNFENDLTNVFVISMYFGSLTQLLVINSRLRKCVYLLCKMYSNWSLRKVFCKLTVIASSNKENDRAILFFQDILERINSDDAKDFFNFALYQHAQFERGRSILTAFNYVGNYFSDADFAVALQEVLRIAQEWKQHFNSRLSEPIFNALFKNRARIDQQCLLDFCLDALELYSNRLFSYSSKLLAEIDLSRCNTDSRARLKEVLTKLLQDKEQHEFLNLSSALISIKRQQLADLNELDSVIEDKLPDFYSNMYRLYTNDDASTYKEFLLQYCQMIEERNAIQGEGGKYIGYVINPYIRIRDIFYHMDFSELDGDIATQINFACIQTLTAPNQLFDSKLEALELIFLILNNLVDDKKEICIAALLDKLSGNDDVYSSGKIFQNQSNYPLYVGVELLRFKLSCGNLPKLAGLLGKFNNAKTIEKLSILKLIECFLYNSEIATSDVLLYLIEQVILQGRQSEVHDINFYTTHALLNLLSMDLSFVIDQIHDIMCNDNGYIKNIIVTNLEKIQKKDKETYDFVIEKATEDSAFFIRNNIQFYSTKQRTESR